MGASTAPRIAKRNRSHVVTNARAIAIVRRRVSIATTRKGAAITRLVRWRRQRCQCQHRRQVKIQMASVAAVATEHILSVRQILAIATSQNPRTTMLAAPRQPRLRASVPSVTLLMLQIFLLRKWCTVAVARAATKVAFVLLRAGAATTPRRKTIMKFAASQVHRSVAQTVQESLASTHHRAVVATRPKPRTTTRSAQKWTVVPRRENVK